jgi:hypothetical protein
MNDAVVLTSQICDIDIWSKSVFINWSIKLATPFVNAYLATGIQLPDSYFDMVRVQDAYFAPKEGFVEIEIVPIFI